MNRDKNERDQDKDIEGRDIEDKDIAKDLGRLVSNDEPTITDQRLDELLSRVDVPAGLKAELMGIPQDGLEPKNPVVRPVGENGSNRFFSVGLIAVAACYLFLAVGVVVFWPADGPAIANKGGDAGLNDRNSRVKGTENSGETQPANSTGDHFVGGEIVHQPTLDSIEEKLNQLKIQELEDRLLRLESSRQVLESSESLALVLAIADQTPLNLGGSKELVDADMQFILDNFPSSQGAEIAAQVADSGN